MGVIYKLTPKVREYILKQRLIDPKLGCRKIVSSVLDKFQIKVSKSSINALIKESGFSMPIGRRGKRSRICYTGLGVIFLKAIDLLVGGSHCFVEAIEKNMEHKVVDIDNKTGALLFNNIGNYIVPYLNLLPEGAKERQMFPLPKGERVKGEGVFNLDPAIKLLLGWGFTNEELTEYLIELQKIKELESEMSSLVTRVFQEIKCIKVEFKDGTYIFIDGQRHNVWATDKIANIFSATNYETSGYINRYFNTPEPFVLLQATGYDKPTTDFFKCVFNLIGDNAISKITLLDNNLKEVREFPYPNPLPEGARERQILPLPSRGEDKGEGGKKHSLLFGLWPWQFTDYRKIKNMGDFEPFVFEALKERLYIADVELELSQPIVNKSVTLRGSVVRSIPDGPTRLFILTNNNEINFEELTRVYFSHWPNLEETFKDYSNKIELYSKSPSLALPTRGREEQMIPSSKEAKEKQILPLPFRREDRGEGHNNIKVIDSTFKEYLIGLNLYFRRYFLPHNYKNNDFSTIKKDFYDLKGTVKKHKNYMLVTFKPAVGYLYLNELKYACNRMNEKFILLPDGRRLLCKVD